MGKAQKGRIGILSRWSYPFVSNFSQWNPKQLHSLSPLKLGWHCKPFGKGDPLTYIHFDPNTVSLIKWVPTVCIALERTTKYLCWNWLHWEKGELLSGKCALITEHWIFSYLIVRDRSLRKRVSYINISLHLKELAVTGANQSLKFFSFK